MNRASIIRMHFEGSWRDCFVAPFRPWVRVVYC